MKSKYLSGFLFVCILFTLNSCKSKGSAYKAAYEAAKVKEMQEGAENTASVEKNKVSPVGSAVIQKEKITVVDGLSSSIQRYNVIIGSFTNKTNALSLKERMISRGYSAFLAQNEKGMYRVIAATFSNKTDAATERDNLKAKYYPEFQDAWILDRN